MRYKGRRAGVAFQVDGVQPGYVELADERQVGDPVIVHPKGQGLTVVDALIVKRRSEEVRK